MTRAALALCALAAAAGALAFSDDSTPRDQSNLTPLRVASGDEIATGFAVGRGQVVTVAHVVEGAVRVAGIRARVIALDRRSDIALLSVPGLAAPTIAADSAPAGSRVRLLRIRNGRPSSLSVDVRRPIVAHVRAAGAARSVTRPALELAVAVAPGDSGAPVVSSSGELAGVIFAASRGRADTAYAVDASAVNRLLPRGRR